MRNCKKILAVLLAVLICFAVCACNNTVDNENESSSNTVTQGSVISNTVSETVTSDISSSKEEKSSETVISDVSSSKEGKSSETVSTSPSSAVSKKTTSVTSSKKDTSSKAKNNETEYPYLLSVNRKQNVVTVYKMDDNGNYTEPVKAMVCSCGIGGKTPTGTFNTTNKYVWRALVGGVYGQYATRITGSILFHSVPYFKQDKGALEYEEYNKLGSEASRGCVRLAVIDAKWIYDNCKSGTTVKIYDGDEKLPLGKPTAQKIDVNSKNRGWDPTDPDSANPWKSGK